MGNLLCMGLSFASGRISSPRSGDVADDRLTARMHMYMLDGAGLLVYAAVIGFTPIILAALGSRFFKPELLRPIPVQ